MGSGPLRAKSYFLIALRLPLEAVQLRIPFLHDACKTVSLAIVAMPHST